MTREIRSPNVEKLSVVRSPVSSFGFRHSSFGFENCSLFNRKAGQRTGESGRGWVGSWRTAAAASAALRRTPLQRAFEDFTQLFRSEFNRIGLHAASLQGRRDNRRRVVGADSITMERQDFQVRTEVLHPDNSFGGAHAITADEQPCDVVV